MIEQGFAKKFAQEWINAWNSHDLEEVLQHYTDDFNMETPMALKFMPETGGIVYGKRQYGLIGKPGLKRYLICFLNCMMY